MKYLSLAALLLALPVAALDVQPTGNLVVTNTVITTDVVATVVIPQVIFTVTNGVSAKAPWYWLNAKNKVIGQGVLVIPADKLFAAVSPYGIYTNLAAFITAAAGGAATVTMQFVGPMTVRSVARDEHGYILNTPIQIAALAEANGVNVSNFVSIVTAIAQSEAKPN